MLGIGNWTSLTWLRSTSDLPRKSWSAKNRIRTNQRILETQMGISRLTELRLRFEHRLTKNNNKKKHIRNDGNIAHIWNSL